jgi:methylmalonyl-CoA mutase
MLTETGARPKIFLACLGPQADFTARASFATNVFESGGIEAVSQAVEPATLGDAFKRAGTPLACLCAADRAYQEAATHAITALKAAGAQHIYLAGRPGPREAEWRTAGLQSFIYEGCDLLATLQAAYDILGKQTG